jgi:hypothetical protein
MANQMTNIVFKLNEEAVKRAYDEFENSSELAIKTAIMSIPDFSDILAYNVDNGRIEITDDFELNESFHVISGELDKRNVMAVLMFLQQNGYATAKQTIVRDILEETAQANTVSEFDKILATINENGHYDPSIYEKVMYEWLHAPKNEYSIFWLKSLLGSILHNQTFKGSNALYSPVPQRYTVFGAQGIGKSAFFNGISFSKMFDFYGDVSNKDTQIALASTLIANADDKAGSQLKSVVDEIKSAISMPLFQVRRPYAQYADILRNKAVFVATTNRHYIFTDTTGDRREMPIEFGIDMSPELARKHGQDFYFDNLQGTNELFETLWFTFLHDNKKEPFNATIKAGTDLDKQRSEIVQRHSNISDTQMALDTILSKKVPDNFLELDKNDMINYLADDDYKFGSYDTIDRLVNEDSRQLRDYNQILQTVIHKAVRTLAGRTTSSAIKELMMGYGYRPSNNGGAFYVK